MQVIIIIAFVFRLKTKFPGIDFEFVVRKEHIRRVERLFYDDCLSTNT
jgi:hypothetical protein